MHTKLLQIAMTVLAYVVVAATSTSAADQPKSGPAHVTAMIGVADMDKSIDYYTRLIGLKEANRIPLGGGAFEIILSPSGEDWDSAVALIYMPAPKQPLQQGTAFNRIAIFVPSAQEVDARVHKIAGEGYKIVIPPTTSEVESAAGKRVYRYAHFKDPDGYTVEFTYFDPKAHR